jgi:hypothetical protein
MSISNATYMYIYTTFGQTIAVSWKSRDSPSACQGFYFSSSKISSRQMEYFGRDWYSCFRTCRLELFNRVLSNQPTIALAFTKADVPRIAIASCSATRLETTKPEILKINPNIDILVVIKAYCMGRNVQG